jgi:hypothetical protein
VFSGFFEEEKQYELGYFLGGLRRRKRKMEGTLIFLHSSLESLSN